MPSALLVATFFNGEDDVTPVFGVDRPGRRVGMGVSANRGLS
jgi:hypothetical protein